MPGAHRSREAKQLKTAGLITLTAASLLMMLWAVFPSAVAFAGSGTEADPFSPGDKVAFCHYDGSDGGGGGSGKYNSPDATVSGNGPNGHGVEHSFDVIPSFWFNQHPVGHPQFDPDESVFFPGVNWPILNNLPSSPVDFTPLEGSSASDFIAGGCSEPRTSTSTTPPQCPSGTSTVTERTTSTETVTTTVTSTETVTTTQNDVPSGDTFADAAPPNPCATTTTVPTTVTITSTVPTTVTTTTTVPLCPEGTETVTTTSTAPPVTTTVTVGDQPLQQPPECTSTETTTTTPTETTTVTTTPPEECPSGTTTTTVTAPAQTETVTETRTSTVTVPTTVTETTTVTAALAGGPNPAPGFDQPLQEGFCHETTTTTPTDTETTTVNTTTTVTSPTTVTQSTTVPTTRVAPTTIEPTTDETVSPTTVTPPGGTAFTGVQNIIPLGTIALVLMTAGSGLLWAGSRRGRREGDED